MQEEEGEARWTEPDWPQIHTTGMWPESFIPDVLGCCCADRPLPQTPSTTAAKK